MKRVLLAGLAIAVLFGTALEIRFVEEVKARAIPCPCEKKRIGDCDGKCSTHCSCPPKKAEKVAMKVPCSCRYGTVDCSKEECKSSCTCKVKK